MGFKLLSTINEAVKTETDHRNLLEERTIELFNEEAATTYDEYVKAWERGMDSTTKLDEVSGAAMGRAAELDWVQHATAQSKEMKREKNRSLGIIDKSQPTKGELVVLGAGGLGQIVATDPQDDQVIIRDKSGNEKVFKNDQLLGPKMVNGKRTWALKR